MTMNKTKLAIAAVLLLGVIGAVAILRSEPAGHGAHDGHEAHGERHDDPAAAKDRAPHGADEKGESEGHAGTAELDAAQLKQGGVELATAGPAPLDAGLQLLGEVRLNQDRSVVVTPRLAGLAPARPARAGDPRPPAHAPPPHP